MTLTCTHDRGHIDRGYLAGELHDTVGHALSGIAVAAAGVRQVLARAAVASPPADADTAALRMVAAIERCAADAVHDLHELLGLLRPGPHASEHRATPQRRLADLPELLERTRALGLSVHHREAGDPRRLTPPVEHIAYRVIQEGLTNALKYAAAGIVDVRLTWHAAELVVAVRSESGSGPAAGANQVVHGGRGLAGLAHRVRAVGGHLTAGPEGAGFLLHARLPLSRPDVGIPLVSPAPERRS